MPENKREIHERIYKFVLQVLRSIKLIPRTTENLVLIRQVIRSASSIGANALEADGSETKKESTLYLGEHYVECYIIKDNRCVATAQVFIPIG